MNQIAPYTYPMKVLAPADLATGLAFMGLASAVGSTVSGGICGALLMLVFAFMFRDVQKANH